MRVSHLLDLEIRERFSGDEAGIVVRQIEAADPWWDDHTEADPHANDRVLLAVLKLSQGRLPQFEVHLRDACGDFRDVLMAAGCGNDDWRAVLARDGFRVPPQHAATPAEPVRVRRPTWIQLARYTLFLCLLAAVALHWLGRS